MAKHRSTDRSIEETPSSDAAVFRAAVRDVVPLAQAPPIAGLAKPKPRVRARRPAAVTETIDEIMPLIAVASGDEPAGRSDVVAGGATLSFHRAGVRTQVIRRLRRGLYPPESELDLHGLTQMAARDQLAQFLARSRDAGLRCVRIVHGKGYRSGGRGPVLKVAVNLWLRRHMNVLAFESARAIDGGTGALYVLLRG